MSEGRTFVGKDGACCPTCNRPWAEPPSYTLISTTPEFDLAAVCAVRGWRVTGDGWVSEKTAAAILGRSEKTLRNRRAIDRPLAFRKRGGRVEYSLAALAAHLAETAQAA